MINGDHRINSTYRRENLGKNLAISLSFNPATLKCGCVDGLPLLQRRDITQQVALKGRVIVLSDHCFSPSLRITDHSNGDCIAIARIEHGDLFELADIFFSLNDNYKIQRGSIVLLSSVSHLAHSGLDAYAADMANVIGRIKTRLSGTVEAFPIAPCFSADAKTSAWLGRFLTSACGSSPFQGTRLLGTPMLSSRPFWQKALVAHSQHTVPTTGYFLTCLQKCVEFRSPRSQQNDQAVWRGKGEPRCLNSSV